MQRYAQGLEVPKIKIDSFTGKTTGATGYFDVNLTYTPKSINNVLVYMQNSVTKLRLGVPTILTGKTLRINVFGYGYYKITSLTTTAENSGGAGADPHDHALSQALTSCDLQAKTSELQDPLTVHYEVA